MRTDAAAPCACWAAPIGRALAADEIGLIEVVSGRIDHALDGLVGPGTVDEELMIKSKVPYKIIGSNDCGFLEGLNDVPSGTVLRSANRTE